MSKEDYLRGLKDGREACAELALHNTEQALEIKRLKTEAATARMELHRSTQELNKLRRAAEGACKVIDRNLYNLREKVKDAAKLLRDQLKDD